MAKRFEITNVSDHEFWVDGKRIPAGGSRRVRELSGGVELILQHNPDGPLRVRPLGPDGLPMEEAAPEPASAPAPEPAPEPASAPASAPAPAPTPAPTPEPASEPTPEPAEQPPPPPPPPPPSDPPKQPKPKAPKQPKPKPRGADGDADSS